MIKFVFFLYSALAIVARVKAAPLTGDLTFPEQQLGQIAVGSATLDTLGDFDAEFVYDSTFSSGTYTLTIDGGTDTITGRFTSNVSFDGTLFQIVLNANISGGTGAFGGIKGGFDAIGTAVPSSLSPRGTLLPGETDLEVTGGYNI